jgi:hypothetical protein
MKYLIDESTILELAQYCANGMPKATNKLLGELKPIKPLDGEEMAKMLFATKTELVRAIEHHHFGDLT